MCMEGFFSPLWPTPTLEGHFFCHFKLKVCECTFSSPLHFTLWPHKKRGGLSEREVTDTLGAELPATALYSVPVYRRHSILCSLLS
jgi:hypothetical protein